MKQKLALV